VAATVLLACQEEKSIGMIFGSFENRRDCLWKVFKSSRPSCEKSCINWSEGFKFADFFKSYQQIQQLLALNG
jgi:hypothetical protein